MKKKKVFLTNLKTFYRVYILLKILTFRLIIFIVNSRYLIYFSSRQKKCIEHNSASLNKTYQKTRRENTTKHSYGHRVIQLDQTISIICTGGWNISRGVKMVI